MEVTLANLDFLEPYERFLSECYLGGLRKYKDALGDPRKFLELVVSNCDQTSTFFCVEHNEILGAIRFRNHTDEYIENVIGHIGYETKPSARGKGIAKFMLSWVQKNIIGSDVIITCEVDNVASEKVITSCGGEYLNEIFSIEKQSHVKRFRLQNTYNALQGDG